MGKQAGQNPVLNFEVSIVRTDSFMCQTMIRVFAVIIWPV